MRLEIMALSDTHLGEDTSLLSFPQGRQALWRALREAFSPSPKGTPPDQTKPFPVRKLVLVGDIPDRTLSSTAEIVTHTNALVDMLGCAADVEEAIYIPGNHDHTLWSRYRSRRPGGEGSSITWPGGEILFRAPAGLHSSAAGDDARDELLSLFFGKPHGSDWRAIIEQQRLTFRIANPVYATTLKTSAGMRTYAFAHGTHFRALEVTRPLWLRRLLARLPLNRLVPGVQIEPGGELDGKGTLAALECAVTPFVDSLWESAENDPTTARDDTWSAITSELRRHGKTREPPTGSQRFCADRHDLDSPVPGTGEHEPRIASLTAGGKWGEPLRLWWRYFRRPMLRHLKQYGFDTRQLTFVFGDTHTGGWGRMAREPQAPIDVFNTGAWVVDSKDDHPPCHVFFVDERGREGLLDVTFRDVKVGPDDLLDLASRGVEHRGRRRCLGARVVKLIVRLWLAWGTQQE